MIPLIPLSFAQQRLWFLSRLEGPSPTYNITGALRLRGALDRAALAGAFGDVVARHEALRTVFPDVDGQPYQRVLTPEEAGFRLRVVECAAAELPQRLRDAAGHRFDLTEPRPLLRVTLFAIAPDEHALLVVVHHIAADGWSMAPLLRDLGTAYAARQAGQPPGWAPLPVQYIDYTLWQRELLGSADDPSSLLAAQLAYWTGQLAGAPECLALPTDRPRPPVASFRGESVSFDIDADLHARLVELARATGTTLFMVLHAALASLLHRLGAGTDITVGTPLAGRTDEALDDLVGFFVNTVVLRTTVARHVTYRQLLNHIRDTDLAAYSHQDTPFEHVVERLNPTRTLAHNPLFQVMLVVQNMPPAAGLLPGLRTEVEPVEVATAKVDLTFTFTEIALPDGGPGGVAASIQYAVDLFDRDTVADLGERLLCVLRAAPADPDRAVERIDVLSEQERRLLVSHPAIDRVAPPSIPDVLVDLARTRPDEVALVCGATRLTYAELAGRVDRLARALAARGVGAEVLVAVLLPRSAELVVAILAVLRAGGGYVPVDPDYPDDRIRLLLRACS